MIIKRKNPPERRIEEHLLREESKAAVGDFLSGLTPEEFEVTFMHAGKASVPEIAEWTE